MTTTSQPAGDPQAIEVTFPALLGYSDGNTGTPYVHVFDSGRPGPHAMVNALTHGNEVCGAIAVKELLDLGLRPRRGRLTLSFANTAAYERFDPLRPLASRFVDQDFNRVWSPRVLDDLDKTSCELARARALRPFVDAAELLLDLHSMQEFSPPLGLSGPLDKGIALARAVGAPQHVIVDAGHPEGVRMRDYGGFGDPASSKNALLVECGQHWQLESVTVARDSVARFLRHAGVIEARDLPPDWLLPDPPARLIVQVTEPVVANGPDFRFAAPYTGLERIAEAGSVIGWRDGEPVRTPYPDCVLVMPSARQPRAGATVVRFGRIVGDTG
ncbi:MAG TPA: M14 family metallopeptidase [Burkholderiaceae bacterium]|jgi:predicted deacylase